jgi:hypothetical protein
MLQAVPSNIDRKIYGFMMNSLPCNARIFADANYDFSIDIFIPVWRKPNFRFRAALWRMCNNQAFGTR